MWSDIILAHAQSKDIKQISLAQLYESPLCNNVGIKRRLTMDAVKTICSWMHNNKFAEFTSDSRESIFLYWRSIQEVA